MRACTRARTQNECCRASCIGCVVVVVVLRLLRFGRNSKSNTTSNSNNNKSCVASERAHSARAHKQITNFMFISRERARRGNHSLRCVCVCVCASRHTAATLWSHLRATTRHSLAQHSTVHLANCGACFELRPCAASVAQRPRCALALGRRRSLGRTRRAAPLARCLRVCLAKGRAATQS